MRKHLLKIIIAIAIFTAVGTAYPQVAEASCPWWLALSDPAICAAQVGAAIGGTIMDSIFSEVGNLLLMISSWFLSLAGIILNISIILTMNIKALYEATPAIEQTWIIIRNLSSLFIIFALLYASINTILGTGGPNFKSLIGKIFIAGLLINFSLFFTKILIDGSNLISLQFYRAIAPKSQSFIKSENINLLLGDSFSKGGLSDIFLQSLKIPKIYNNQQGVIKNPNRLFLIAVSTIGGSVLMILAAFSFIFASLAFIIRIAVLLLVMGFSPVYFVGKIFPEVDKQLTSKFKDYFIGQLTFMPAYLLLMYVAVRFLSDGGGINEGFFSKLNEAQLKASAGAESNSGFLLSTAGLMFQYIIAFVFINIPLLAAMQMGGVSTKWAGAATNKIKGIIGRNTAGRLGRFAGKGFDSMAAVAQGNAAGRATSTVLRTLGVSQAIRGGLDKAEKGKYAGKQNLGDMDKENKERTKFIGGVHRVREQKSTVSTFLDENRTTPPTITDVSNFRKTVGGMDAKELQEYDVKELSKPQFIMSIPSAKFESLLKELPPYEQQELKTAREKAFTDLITQPNGAETLLNDVLKNKPSEIAKLPTGVLTTKDVAIRLDAASLRKMIDENVGSNHRDTIRTMIENENATPTLPTPPPTLAKAVAYLKTPSGQIF